MVIFIFLGKSEQVVVVSRRRNLSENVKLHEYGRIDEVEYTIGIYD